MNNNLLQLKIKQRLNKQSSNDYDSFECWMIVEAFNKAQNEWVRTEARSSEVDKTNVDDLQKITKLMPLVGSNKPGYYESDALPVDYFAGRRISASAVTEGCINPRKLIIYSGDESNLDELLRDGSKNPNFEWGETFSTLVDNKIHIHTSDKFSIVNPTLTYYRKPVQISIDGCVDEYDKITSGVECEFKDDLVELLISKTVTILAYDIESLNTAQINQQDAIQNK